MYTTMTIKERIDKFIEKHPIPYQTSIRLRWTRADGEHKKDCFTENGLRPYNWYRDIGEFIPYVDRVCCTRVYSTVHTYDEELGLFEIGCAEIKATTPKEGEETRAWKYVCRNFIPVEKKRLYNQRGTSDWFDCIIKGKKDITFNEKEFFSYTNRLAYDNNNFERNFVKFIGNRKKVCGNRYPSSYKHNWVLWSWYCYNEKVKKEGEVSPTQKKIDNYNALFNFKNSHCSLTFSDNMLRWTEDNVCTFESKDNIWGFRIFNRHEAPSKNFVVAETKRVFVDFKKGSPVVTVANLNSNGDWVPNGSFTQSQFDFPVMNIDKLLSLDNFKFLNIACPSECVKNSQNGLKLYKLIQIIKCPEIEQLCNMGLSYLVQKICNGGFDKTAIDRYLGEPNKPKAKNVLSKYGVTRAQLFEVESLMHDHEARYIVNRYYYSCCYKPITIFKEIVEKNDISSYDIKTINEFTNYILEHWDWSFNRSFNHSGFTVVQKVTMLKRLGSLTAKGNGNYFKVFADILSTYKGIPTDSRPTLIISELKDESDFNRMHDSLIQIANAINEERNRWRFMSEQKRNEALEKKMKEIDKERQKYNYEEGDFLIKLPERIAEITNEGMKLSHCVGGYAQTHAQGYTTILFLRKKEEPDTPFYTIEVKNNTVAQIHGFGNKWLGNNPEAIPCVYHWVKKLGLRITDKVLRSTSHRYGGSGGGLVPMPAV